MAQLGLPVHIGTAEASVAAERVATVAARYAEEVDLAARFPSEAFSALRAERLMAATVPVAMGGLGLSIAGLAGIATRLAQGCASTAMIWAMHQIQLACIVRHTQGAPYFARYLQETAERQLLIASVTSEIGVGGDIRTSIASVEQSRLQKHGSAISYGAYADAFLVTARRTSQAQPHDQVLVLLHRTEVELEQTGQWNTLGMRGTCSPSFRIDAVFDAEQILPSPFGEICASTMVPYSHILWAACWLGIATDALGRARRSLRSRSGASQIDRRLSDASGLLQQLHASVAQAACDYEREMDSDTATPGLRLAIEMNQLKLGASDLVVRIVSEALAICGMAGYQSDGPYSVARHLRDAYSARCMVSNERLREANAGMLLLYKGGI